MESETQKRKRRKRKSSLWLKPPKRKRTKKTLNPDPHTTTSSLPTTSIDSVAETPSTSSVSRSSQSQTFREDDLLNVGTSGLYLLDPPAFESTVLNVSDSQSVGMTSPSHHTATVTPISPIPIIHDDRVQIPDTHELRSDTPCNKTENCNLSADRNRHVHGLSVGIDSIECSESISNSVTADATCPTNDLPSPMSQSTPQSQANGKTKTVQPQLSHPKVKKATHRRGTPGNRILGSSKRKLKKTPSMTSTIETPKRPKKCCALNFDSKAATEEPAVKAARQAFNTLMEPLLNVLNKSNLLFDFVVFLRVLVNGRLSTTNIAFLLLLERARFAHLATSTSMYYWPETLKFWKIVYKILHGKAIRLFSGLKNVGQVIKGETTSGHYDPTTSVCNFAVPEVRTLNRMTDPNNLPKEIPPGIIKPAIDLASKQQGKEFVLCVDGKKVAAGLNKQYGDIDLWSHEIGTTLAEAKARLRSETEQTETLVEILVRAEEERSDPLEVLNHLRTLGTILSRRVADGRHLALYQQRNLEKLQKLAVTNPDNAAKYNYAMSFTQTSIFQSKRYIASTLDTISQICELGSALNSSSHFRTGEISVCHQGNMIHLKEPADLPQNFATYKFTKQRTPEWYELRKLAPVTGSTLHKGIGLGTLKDQRKHCDEHIMGTTTTAVSSELQARFDHGTKNEGNATVTLAATVLPFLFPPGLGVVEDGAHFIRGKTKDTLIEVSSDGSLRTVEGTHVGGQSLYTVEIKCPYPNKNVLPVHYKPPKYYVCQLLAEMAAHSTSVGLYVTYSKESMTVCKVSFDDELWQMILDEVEALYGGEKVVKLLRKTENAKRITEKLGKFIEEKVEFVLEVPSCTAHVQSNVTCTVADLPYVFPISDIVINKRNIDPQALCKKMKESVEEGYRLNRKKATEILAFVLSDSDRIWVPEQPHHLPIAYAMKGPSIQVRTVEAMVSEVRKQCDEAGVNIMCESYDGQWYPLVIRDSKGRPLTRLQFLKDVWKEALKLTKPQLLQFFRHLLKQDDSNEMRFNVQKNEGILEVTSTGCKMATLFRSWTYKGEVPPGKPIKKDKRRKNPPPLKGLSHNVISSTYSKHLLSIRYAEAVFLERLHEWEAEKSQGVGVRIKGIEQEILFYSFVKCTEAKQYRPKVLDPSHLLVNCRVKATKDGFKGVDAKAFLAVAESDPTIVNRAIVADALDKQSVAIAERVFSENVEKKMIELGFPSTAEFVHCIRNWYDAIDQPGLKSVERVKKLLHFKNWLLDGVSLTSFPPPPGRHIKGIPAVMWEGFLQNIDTRIQLYSISKNKTYNHRSVGTLAVESFFSDLTDIEPTKKGCPKAIHIPRLMASVTELNHYRHDPERSFQINTSRAKVYPHRCLMPPVQDNETAGENGPDNILPCGEEGSQSNKQPQNPTTPERTLTLRDHSFDSDERGMKKRRKKKSTLSKPDEPVRGAVTLRSRHYKINEELVDPWERLAVPDNEKDITVLS